MTHMGKFRKVYRFVQCYVGGPDYVTPDAPWFIDSFIPGELGPVAVIYKMERSND